jgi:acetoin utilization deacetylase AcuC-like enzyme
MNTAIVYTPKYLDHDTGLDHPETPDRLRVIVEELNRSGLLKTRKCSILTPKPAKLIDLELVHEPDYIELVQQSCAIGGGLLDLGDTVVGAESCKVAFLAVGGILDAVNLVVNGKARNAFALVRPPGHHAGPYYALGFCLFNNVAIAAVHMLRRLGFNRVLILDIDAHHGNGTQEIFYDTNKVLYVSLHQDPRGFPGTGFMDETGEGEGLGYTVNVPFPLRVDDRLYHKGFDQIAAPIIQQYKPQFILVSAGFDGHYTDPVGSLSLSMQGYSQVFLKILNLASQLCNGRLVVALEGGYSLSFLGKMVTSAIARMTGIPYRVRDKSPVAHPRIRKNAEQVLSNVRRIQSSFWQL